MKIVYAAGKLHKTIEVVINETVTDVPVKVNDDFVGFLPVFKNETAALEWVDGEEDRIFSLFISEE